MKDKISNLAVRIITAIFIIAATVLILWFSDNGAFLRFIAAVFSCFAVYEFFDVTEQNEHEVWFTGMMIVAFLLSFIEIPYYKIILAIAFLIAVVTSACMMRWKEKFYFGKPTAPATLSAVVILFFAAIPKIRAIEHGLYYLICPILICITTDAAAYFVGKKWGNTKLIPRVSPNKTVEGAAAGIGVSFVFAIAFGLLLQFGLGVIVKWKIYITYALFTSLVGQFGDLTGSIVKRIANVKDFGTVLPGHGGVLDRLDSHSFAFAFTYLFCVFGGAFLI